MKVIHLYQPQLSVQAQIGLPSSKSESNRALIIDALTNHQCVLHNLSEARDTQTMLRLLHAPEQVADVIDAGTTLRFLTAYFAITNQNKILTGTPRMRQRPIGILVDALRALGADIAYLENDGFPPFHVRGFDSGRVCAENSLDGDCRLKLRSDVSSQFISALLLIAPLLPNGLLLELQGEVGSKPYIEMTLQQMAHFGIEYNCDWTTNVIRVTHQRYQPRSFAVESDWSAASYWYAIAALADDAEIELMGLKEDSSQGDSVISEIMSHLGVHTEFIGNRVILTKREPVKSYRRNFIDCPDLAQTVAVVCAAKGIALTMTGIESLKIKETDRILALRTELAKLGAELAEVAEGKYELRSRQQTGREPEPITIQTYEDHRMAMAFAPLAMRMELRIENPDVVVKSYPGFWHDLEKVMGCTMID
ncbi:MAG: 3-phosphoshikimate 1-carboxyvinyltransferase [Ferruginibacter sp.]|nr:3-phosphoshikimate 1-carboxyvinyltransferase [Cytophagales bacterium]